MSDSSEKLAEIDSKENEILAEAEAIKEAEVRIRQHESQILESERKILQKIKQRPLKALVIEPGLTRRELSFLQSALIRKIARHKLLYAVLITITFVLVWRGTWETLDMIPALSNPLVSLGLGLVLVWLLKKTTELQEH